MAAGAVKEAVPDFNRQIRPIFAARCFSCHGPHRQDGGLRLDLRGRAVQGGDSGPVIVAKDAAKSELYRRLVTADPKHRMPVGGKPLSPGEIARIRAWINGGAPWPEEGDRGQESRGRETVDHWAFKPVVWPTPPKVRQKEWVSNPIDAFVLAKLEAKRLTPSPPAGRRVLIRRLHLDLIGLPPTPEEVDAFVGDTRPDAYERLVDRLLASPHFGERWGRHWLDLARFAESDGYENDRVRPHAWRFRDWVIDAVNRDMPFDQFTVEQLAGDLIPNATPAQKIAAGFHRNTLWNSAASADKEEFRTYAVKDRTDTTATVWMGLTAGCAKCHTHKYDPITQREYYQFYAFFNATDNDDTSVSGGQAQTLKAVARETYIHLRGNFLQKGEVVAAGTPAFLPPLKPRGERADRLDLARWLVSGDHPLTARVAVNHVWQALFGQGLVPTPDNYGRSGRPPVQRELLDYLASVFSAKGGAPFKQVSGGQGAREPAAPERVVSGAQGSANTTRDTPYGMDWSRKALIRLIVTSSTYRQASALHPELRKSDLDNSLLGRQNRFRVEAEIVRDLSLAVSGLLDPKVGGPSIVPPFPEGLIEQRFTNEDLKLPGPERHRRGVYIHVQRTLQHPVLAAFDGADGNQACVRRDRSNTPIQAFTLLNDPTYVECARALGERLRKSAPESEGRLRFGFRVCLGREPRAQELAVLSDLVRKQAALGASEEAIWTGVGRTLLNLEEFTTRE